MVDFVIINTSVFDLFELGEATGPCRVNLDRVVLIEVVSNLSMLLEQPGAKEVFPVEVQKSSVDGKRENEEGYGRFIE